MTEGLGRTLYGAVLALPWYPGVCWVALIVGLLSGNFVGWMGRKESLADLRGSTVLITGSSMGIGEHIAYQFAEHGARIVITARSEDKLQRVLAKCKELGASQVYYFVADMQNSKDVNHLIEFVKEKFRDKLDYLVLNHIIQNKAKFWESGDLDNLRKLYDCNFFAYVQLATAFLPNLEQNNGRIAAVSSIVAKHSFPFFVPYASTKSAAESFFVGLRQELAMKSSKISITIAVLGRIDTPGQINAVRDKFLWAEMFPSESPSTTAEVIVRGTHDRVRELYHPRWMIGPISYIINIPFIRPVFEKLICFGLSF